MQHDLKRLLAYSHGREYRHHLHRARTGARLQGARHGLGGGARRSPPRFLHVFNHSVFKSLLFFGAGAVLNATGERDMEHLGGLIHRMPQTAFAFLVGCAAISALPPLNGFVSEWLMFQAILLSPELPSWGLKFLVPAVGALLALSAALAAACFVKAFGVTFLGRAAHRRRRRARTKPTGSRWRRCSVFAALCLLAGILPGLFIDALAPVVQSPGRRPDADADRRRVAVDRADRREPQLLQWSARVPVHAGLGHARGRSPSTASPPTGCAAARHGTAAIPIRARRRSTPRRASPSRFAASSAPSSFVPASRSRCRRPAIRVRRG